MKAQSLLRALRLPVALVAILLSIYPSELSAQTIFGTIKGVVKDPSGAVVPGVPVIVTNVGTARSRQGLSNDAGEYVIADLAPAEYQITATREGFKKWTSKLTLRTLQTAVVDITLEVGQATITIEVRDSTPVITTSEATLGDVKEAERIKQLPLNGRDLAQLFTLTPGVTRRGGTGMSGIQAGAFQFLQDGVSIENKYTGDIVRNPPALEGVAEFKIETTNSSAIFSRPGNVTLVTKSGGNAWHGSIFETHRNNCCGLRTRDIFQNSPDPEENKPLFLIRNEFGASVGGPIRIPKVYNGRDKTFFFFTYEGLRQRQKTHIIANSPPQALRDGDFSNYHPMYSEDVSIIYDPLTTRPDPDNPGFFIRDPFPGNIIPPDRISPMAKAALKFYPLPNQPGLDYDEYNIRVGLPIIDDRNRYTAKLDHHFSEKDTLSGSYSFIDQANTQSRSGYGGTPTTEIYFNKGTSRTQIITLSETHIFGPNAVNELHLGATRPHDRRGPPIRTPARTTLMNLPNVTGDTGWPCLWPGDENWETDTGLHFDDDNPQEAPQVFLQANDNLSMQRGTHHFNLGGYYRALTINSDERGQPRGCYSFGTDSTGLEDGATGLPLPGTGSGLASFLLGIPDYADLRSDKGFFYHRQKEFAVYFQDDWKVTPRLTLNLGLRYDYFGRYRDKRNQIATFDPASGAIVTPFSVWGLAYPPAVAAYEDAGVVFKTAGEVGFPLFLLKPDRNDIAPRVGVAFKLTEKTVLRGGYGIYYWTTPLITLQAPSRQNPPFNFTRSAVTGDPNETLRRVPPFIMGLTPPDQIFSNTQISISGSNLGINPFDPYMQDSWADTWNVTVERELLAQTSLRVSYVGTRGHNLQIVDPINTPAPASLYPDLSTPERRQFPLYSNMATLKVLGSSQSHQLQIEVKRTTRRGITAQGFYVFQKTADTSTFSAASSAALGVLGAGQSGIADINARLQLEKGESGNYPRHNVSFNFLIDLPFGPGHAWTGGTNPVVGKVIGGWQVASISAFRSGFPFSTNRFTGGRFYDRVCNGNLPSGERTRTRWFDPGCFVRGGDVITSGYPGRNVLEGPGLANVDFSIVKNTSIYEKATVRFTADFFNLFNHPSLATPGTGGSIGGLENAPRIIQFGLRVEF
jgi:hypothetical protein